VSAQRPKMAIMAIVMKAVGMLRSWDLAIELCRLLISDEAQNGNVWEWLT
jgi:hypothetical protein